MIEIIRSDGETFLFEKDFRIFGLDGFGNLDVILTTEDKAFGDGDILLGKRIPSRQLSIDSRCHITDIKKAKKIREEVTRFFNDDYKYVVRIDYKNIKKEIKCELKGKVLPTDNVYKPQVLSVIFLALDPFFESIDTFGKDIASKNSLLGFPVYIMKERYGKNIPQGMAFGFYNFDKSVKIENDGDKETYFRAEIYAKDEVDNFKLIKSSTEYLLFLKTLKKGDILKVDFENSYVELNGQNANQFVDKTSTFFKIPKGESTISFDATRGETQIVVKLFYQKKYLGV